MTRARKSRHRQLRIEPLESRQLLATGITGARNSAGVLTIKGTSKSDDILFREISGMISIEGFKTTWSATKVKSIAVKLGATGAAGGNDYVSFNSLANGGNQTLAENITITSSKGNDHVTLPDSDDIYFSGLGHTVAITAAGVTTLDRIVVDPLPSSPVTIGDYVWNDTNANGIQDSGETGIAGVTFTLTGTNGSGTAVTDHATTDSTGHYLFTETPGTYTVTVDASNFASGGVLAGDTASPSNPNPSSTGALLGGASDLNLDFGYFRKVTIGDYVWNDANANGIQDSGETGIAGVTLTLTGTNGSGTAVTDHATTDSTGHYLFTETPGTYTVTVDASNFASGGVLVGDTASPTLQGSNRSVDSNANPSGTAALLGGGSDLSIDFGYFRKVTIGDYVWNDANANGIQDSGETGIAGVTLTLTGTNGSGTAVTDHATTDSTGHYLFTETPGTYTVTLDASNFASGGVLVGDTASPTLQGSNRSVDSNANPSGTAALLGGGSDLSIDFGYFRKVTIGDYVWNDANANGIQDSGETGIAGVTLTLTGTNGSGTAVTDHATTDSTGHYLFTETPGTYTVTLDASNFASGGVLVGDTASPTLQGSNRSVDSNANPSGTAALLGGGSDLSIDFGYFRKVTIGDYVWNDANANGIQDSGETGIAGVTLTLTGTNGSGTAVTDHATTDSTGHYLFTETPGTYTVTLDASNFASGGVLVGDTASPTLQGSNRSVDSNANPSGTAALLGGGSDLSIDFGYYASSTSTTWFDTHITTVAIRSLADADFQQDPVLSRTDMLGIFQAVAQAGAVTSTELTDLTSIVDDASLFGNLNYVQQLSQDIVLGNLANATYQGSTLGDLAVGSSATQLEDLVDKWFLGTDHPTANGNYQTASGPLFGAQGPQYTDIVQGGLEDCYLMSALAEVALNDPSVITSMFINNGDGTYTFRYYTDASPYTQQGTATYITIDSQLPSGYASYSHVLWVALAEKAYAQIKGGYSALNLGDPAVSLNQITGNTWLFPINTLSDFVAAYNAGDMLALDSSATPASPNVVKDHAYALVSYNSATEMLTLYNPWGSTITISWNDVAANFASIEGVNPS